MSQCECARSFNQTRSLRADRDIRVLSSHALAALQEFYADRDAHEERFERLKEDTEKDGDNGTTTQLSMETFAEDWNKSQFWVGCRPKRSRPSRAPSSGRYTSLSLSN